jgi:hypothetical protein
MGFIIGTKNQINEGPLHIRSQDRKNLGPTLSIFGLMFSPELLINALTLAKRVGDWLPKFEDILFSALGPIQGHKVQLITWGRLKRFFREFGLDS